MCVWRDRCVGEETDRCVHGETVLKFYTSRGARRVSTYLERDFNGGRAAGLRTTSREPICSEFEKCDRRIIGIKIIK